MNTLCLLFYTLKDEWHCSAIQISSDRDFQTKQHSLSFKRDDCLNEPARYIHKWKYICLLSLLFLTFFMFVGCEHSYTNFLYSYAHLYLSFPAVVAASLSSTLGLSLAIGRLAGIFGAIILRSNHLVLIDFSGCLISLILLTIFTKSAIVLWISTIAYGFLLVSLYPALIDWTQLHFLVDGKVLTILIAGGTTGASTMPLLIGDLFQNSPLGPFVLIVIALVLMVLATFFYIVALYIS